MRSLNLLSVKRQAFQDLWVARDAYIMWCFDRARNLRTALQTAQQAHALTESERVRALELMELQRHAQLMYTSCGWFFDDISA